MQNHNIFQRHVWILSGTGEGPLIARAFLEKGWNVTVSVVSSHAASRYSDISLKNLWTGKLLGVEAIKTILERAKKDENCFDLVLDVTHPFAEIISKDLKKACDLLDQPLLRYERELKSAEDAYLLKNLEDLSSFDLEDKAILIALGARNLKEVASFLIKSGARVFARVLPSQESFKLALNAGLPQSHLALIRPFESATQKGFIEKALCRRWSIDAVICRQSGGLIQDQWQKICKEYGLDLWMIARPLPLKGVELVTTLDALFDNSLIRTIN